MKRAIFNLNKLFSRQVLNNKFIYKNYSEDTFLSAFLRTLKRNLAEDEDLQEDIKNLDETSSMQTIKRTYEMTKEGTKYVYEQTEGFRQVSSEVLQQTGDYMYKGADLIGDTVDTISQNVFVRGVIDELNADYRKLRESHFSFRSEYARNKDAENGIFFNPYTKEFEHVDDKILDEFTESVVIQENTGKKKSKNQKSTMSKIFDGLGGKIFKPSEQSLVLSAIKERNDGFDLDLFIGNVENLLMPVVLKAYFEDNKKEIRRYCSTPCYKSNIWPLFQEREHLGKKFDTKILEIGPTSLYSAQFKEKQPIIMLATTVQYIHKIVATEEDENGEIKVLEGGDDDIRMLSQIWGFRQDVANTTSDWEICELYLVQESQKIAA